MLSRQEDGVRREEAEKLASAISTLRNFGSSCTSLGLRGVKLQLSTVMARAALQALETIADAAAQHPDGQPERAYKAWSGSCAELLSLFALALRQSSRTLSPDSPREETAMYAQLREGLLLELHYLSEAARSRGNTALLPRLGCTLLRTGALQCYTTLLSDAAQQLQPAARTACADLPDRREMVDVGMMVEEVLGCGTAGGLTSPRGKPAAVSGALRLAGEVVRLLELLGACSGSNGEPGDVLGAVLRQLSKLLGQRPGAAALACSGGGTVREQGSDSGGSGVQDSVVGCGEDSQFETARQAASSSGHVSQLYRHASRLLLMATAAARNSATHQRTHEAASRLAEQLVARVCCFAHEKMSATCSIMTDYGSAVAELVRLCATLDGGTTYGMAPGLWPQPEAAGVGGTGGVEAGGSLLAKLRLCMMLEYWGLEEAPMVIENKGRAAMKQKEHIAAATRGVNELYTAWQDAEAIHRPGRADGVALRKLSASKAKLVTIAQQYVTILADLRSTSTNLQLPPCSAPATLQLCMRLARGLLARGRRGGAGGCPPAASAAAGAAETAGAGAGAGAATGGDDGLHAADLLPTAHRVLDRMLLQAAMDTARVVLQPHCDRPARGRAGARRLVRLWGWWKVVLEAARQGVALNAACFSDTHMIAAQGSATLPQRPSADVTAALKAGVLPCCTHLLRHSGLGGGGAGGGGSCGSGGGEAEVAAWGSNSSSSSNGGGRISAAPPAGADLIHLPDRMRLYLEHSSRLGSLLASFQVCNWRQLLAFGRREEVRELTSALAWRLGWQVGQLREAVEEEAGAGAERGLASGQSPEASPAAPGSGAAWHAQEAGEVLLFAAGRLGDMLVLRRQGQGEGGKGETARPAASSGAGTSGSSSATEGGASGGNGEGESGSGGGGHTPTCTVQHLEDGTNAGSGDGTEGGGGGVGSSGGGVSGALDGTRTAASVEAADSSPAMDYGRAAAELWAEVSELLPAAARGVLACAEMVLEEGGGASEGKDGGDGVNGVGAGGAGSNAGAVAGALGQQAKKMAQALRQSYPGLLRCVSMLLLAHVGADAAGAGADPFPWRGVLLGEVQLAGLLGAGVRLWEQVEAGEGGDGKGQVLLLRLLEVAAVAFPAELRAVVQGEGGAAGEAAAGNGSPAVDGSSPRWPQTPPWCRVSLRAVRDALGGDGDGAELQAVCRVAGGWEPGLGERRALLEEGVRRLAAALWEAEVENQERDEAEEEKAESKEAEVGKAEKSKEAEAGQDQKRGEEAEGGEVQAADGGS